jgi:hypothetical protein
MSNLDNLKLPVDVAKTMLHGANQSMRVLLALAEPLKPGFVDSLRLPQRNGLQNVPHQQLLPSVRLVPAGARRAAVTVIRLAQ